MSRRLRCAFAPKRRIVEHSQNGTGMVPLANGSRVDHQAQRVDSEGSRIDADYASEFVAEVSSALRTLDRI
jgi:hypothetical protein